MEVNLTDKFVDEIFIIGNSTHDKDVVNQVIRCLLDYLGVTFAGAKILESKGLELLSKNKSNLEGCSVIGLDKKSDLSTSILLNGLFSHVAELDDGTRFGMIHPGAPIFSAMLPKDFINGIIVAYETSIRLAYAIQPSHYGLGYHPTATCGSVGVSAGISTMLGFSKKKLKDAMSSAMISSAGSLKVIENSSQLKPFNAGRPAVVGYLSSIMAEAGFEGPSDALGGKTGFLSMMSTSFDSSKLIKNNSYDKLSIELVYFKPYAACRHAHPSIEASLELKSKGLKPDEIKKINVYTYGTIIGKHDHNEIHGVSSAKMSIPFSIALSFCEGNAGINDYSEENLSNNKILELANKVKIYAKQEFTELVPNKRIALMEVETYNGKSYSKKIEFPKGEPENQLNDSEIQIKFFDLMKFAEKDLAYSEKIKNNVYNIEAKLQTLLNLL